MPARLESIPVASMGSSRVLVLGPFDLVANAMDEGNDEMKARPQGGLVLTKTFQCVFVALSHDDDRCADNRNPKSSRNNGPDQYRVYHVDLCKSEALILNTPFVAIGNLTHWNNNK
jgi:hypothetical protein